MHSSYLFDIQEKIKMLISTLSRFLLLRLALTTRSNQVFAFPNSSSEEDGSANRSTIELTWHVECQDRVQEGNNICTRGEENEELCKYNNDAMNDCCACGGGNSKQIPLTTEDALGTELQKIDDEVTATSTFVQTHQCLDNEGITKRIPLFYKSGAGHKSISNVEEDLDHIVKHLCNLNVEGLQKRLLELGGEAAFENDFQVTHGNSLVVRAKQAFDKFKKGCTIIRLIFSSKKTDIVYHLPWLDDFLPTLQEEVLQPLGIPVNKIIRLMFSNMPEDSDINFHVDQNGWSRNAHRVHVPIITHPDIFFLSSINRSKEILRIKSGMGEAYEFNNIVTHGVRNTGAMRVHLIIDWMEDIVTAEGDLRYSLVKLPPGQECSARKRNELECTPAVENTNTNVDNIGNLSTGEAVVSDRTESEKELKLGTIRTTTDEL